MRKAVRSVLATRDYSSAAWEIIKNLSSRTDPQLNPLLARRGKVKKIGLVMLASNRGLCGGFNREVVETSAQYIIDQQKKHPGLTAEVFLFGRRGRDIQHRYQHQIVAEFIKPDVAESISQITPLAKMIIADYLLGKYDKITLVYTDFYSAISQKPKIKQLLPIESQDDDLGQVKETQKKTQADFGQDFEYLFEPSPEAVLEQMLYRLIELQIYQALLESNASEHSARMMAMRNASEAAMDMIHELTLSFNQARQQTITAELADISAGRAAVS